MATREEIYSLIPNITCKGLCHEYCGVIGMSRGEFEQIGKPTLAHLEKHGKVFLVTNKDLNCPLLNLKTKRCTVYENRPLICRLWGVVPDMPCPYGCKPERMMSTEESKLLLKMMDGAED